MTTETNKERLEALRKKFIKGEYIHPDNIEWLIYKFQELEISNERCVRVARNRQKHIDNIESENQEITDILVKLRDSFTGRDEQAEGHGMEDAVACPIAVAQYAFNKYKRTMNENARLREALEFYADERNYVLWNSMAISETEVGRDKGNAARTALNTQEDSQ